MAGDERIVIPFDETLGLYLSRLGPGSPTQIRIFDRGDFYSLHNHNAVFVANQFLKSPEAIKYLGKEKVPGVAISKLNYEALVREMLLVRQYRVELHAKEGSKWGRVARGSPGNLAQFEQVLFSNHEMDHSVGVACLSCVGTGGTYRVSILYCDVLLRQLSFCEVSDTEQFCVVEAILVQLPAKEVLLAGQPGTPEHAKLCLIFQRLHMALIPTKNSEFQTEKGRAGLTRLASKEDGLLAKLADTTLSCVAPLIKYLDLSSDQSNMNQFEVIEISPSLYMRLDGGAVSGLNLLPLHPTDPPFSFLWGLLNHCLTPQGQRLLQTWLKQPLLDKHKIAERQDVVEAFTEDGGLRQNLAGALKRIPDFFRIAKKVERGRGELQDCYRLYRAIQQIPAILETLAGYSGGSEATLTSLFIAPLREHEADFAMFCDLVETTVDLGKCEAGEFVIRHTFDEGLTELRGQLDLLEGRVEEEFGNIARLLRTDKGKGVKLDHSAVYGHCCRVTRKEEKGVRQSGALRILQTKKEGVIFTSPALKEVSEEYKAVQANYGEVQAGVVSEVLRVAAGYSEPLILLNNLVAVLDCLLSFALVSLNAPIPYTRPTVLERGSGVIELVGSRHPCVEHNEDVTFISNDVHLSLSADRFLIITGPNMGGKSTYIRQIGVIAILSQIGCFVPAQHATISILSSIHARVGGSDNQSKGVSTFMKEMLDTSAILATADKDSLIIIDELGRGTSTYDGFGLAWSISKHIIERVGCLAVFATHFHEMCNLSAVDGGVKNYHVTAHLHHSSLSLLYKIEAGPSDESLGVHVARLAGFPDSVVERATERTEELDRFKFTGGEGEEEEANSFIYNLLETLSRAYKGGKRGEELREVVEEAVQRGRELVNSNDMLASVVKKHTAVPTNGS